MPVQSSRSRYRKLIRAAHSLGVPNLWTSKQERRKHRQIRDCGVKQRCDTTRHVCAHATEQCTWSQQYSRAEVHLEIRGRGVRHLHNLLEAAVGQGQGGVHGSVVLTTATMTQHNVLHRQMTLMSQDTKPSIDTYYAMRSSPPGIWEEAPR